MKPVRINEIWAWIAVDADDEGIVAGYMGGAWLPFVGADKERIELFRKAAIDAARQGGISKVRLVCFSERIEVEEVKI